MKTLKTGLIAAFLMAIATMITMQSCKKADTNYILTQKNETNQLILGPKITISGKFHRGAKWAEKHGGEPCTQKFGVCGLGFDVEFFPTMVEIVDKGDFKFRFNFLENIGNKEGEIFMSTDDEFTFPSEIAEFLGYSDLHIIPKNYIAHMNANTNLAYVEFECTGNKL